jgi:hypothetical protein
MADHLPLLPAGMEESGMLCGHILTLQDSKFFAGESTSQRAKLQAFKISSRRQV